MAAIALSRSRTAGVRIAGLPSITRPGNAFTSAIIASSESIGETTVVGNAVNSEINAGFH